MHITSEQIIFILCRYFTVKKEEELDELHRRVGLVVKAAESRESRVETLVYVTVIVFVACPMYIVKWIQNTEYRIQEAAEAE